MNLPTQNPTLPPVGTCTLIYAHRGAMAYRPQNTMPAFQLAWEMGVAGVELDVQCSKDGVPIVFHDDTLDALTNGTGCVHDHHASDLLQLGAGSHFSQEYANTTIPTLAEVLRARPAHTLVNIEIKTAFPFFPIQEDDPRLLQGHPLLTEATNSATEKEAQRTARQTIDCIQQLAHELPDLIAHLIISSFHPAALVEFERLMPEVTLGVLRCRTAVYDSAPRMAAIQHSALHLNSEDVTREMVQEAHKKGLYVNCWTVNDIEKARTLIYWGVDGIISNVPDAMLKILNK